MSALSITKGFFSVLACSNEKYGCDYLETKFVNLNSTYRTPRKKIGF